MLLADDISQRALAAEQLRSSRVLAGMRFIGISFAFVLNAILPRVTSTGGAFATSDVMFGVYWLASAALYLTVRRSERVARWVGFDVAALDMPRRFSSCATRYLPTQTPRRRCSV